MTWEVAILRAYAFASQGKYAEAERTLASAPGMLDTPPGADLLARIKFEQGDEFAARRIWEQLVADNPSNESAQKALSALDAPSCESDGAEVTPPFRRRWKFAHVAVSAVLLGIAFSFGKAWNGMDYCQRRESAICPDAESQPRIVSNQTLNISAINCKALSQLQDGILTNMTDNAVLIISGGRGKYATDRQKSLSVIAEAVSENANIPLSNILFRVSDKSSETVKLSVVKGFGARQE